MKTKLTLRMEKELIQQAKEKAKQRGTSVSQMVANFFSLMEEANEPDSESPQKNILPEGYVFSDFTKSATGAFGTWKQDVSPEEAHRQHLVRKHTN